MTLTIYHNPRCGKSRETLALLRARGLEPRIVEYLQTPPDAATLRRLAKMLGGQIADMVRSGEPAFKAEKLAGVTDARKLIAAITRHPILLQRPIVVSGGKAAIGRPPEAVLAIL